MHRFACFSICGALFFIAACSGGDGSGSEASKGAGASETTPRTDPLVGLTKETLSRYVEVLKAAASDSEKDEGDVARERGWDLMEWVRLDARVKGIVKAGGFDAMIQGTRDRLKQFETQIAEFQALPADAPEAQRKFAEKGIQGLTSAVEGMRSTLDQVEALRPGGELVDGMLAELQTLLKR